MDWHHYEHDHPPPRGVLTNPDGFLFWTCAHCSWADAPRGGCCVTDCGGTWGAGCPHCHNMLIAPHNRCCETHAPRPTTPGEG